MNRATTTTRAEVRRFPRRFIASLLPIAMIAATACSSSSDDRPAPLLLTVQTPRSCAIVGCVGEGIDTAAGAYTFATDDLLFPRGLFGLGLARAYRSDRTTAGWFGTGWSTVYETTMTVTDGSADVDAPAGLAPLWSPEAPAEWSIAGEPRAEVAGDGSASLVWPTGETWSFASTGALTTLTSPYGQRVTVERDDTGIVALRSTQGPSITFDREGSRIVRARSDDGRVVSYRYDGARLIESSAPGLTLSFVYNADGRLLERRGPDGTTKVDYAAGRVAGQTLPKGDTIGLTYEAEKTTVVDRETSIYVHDTEGRLRRITRGGADVLVRRFDNSGRLVEETVLALPQKEAVHTTARSYEGDRLIAETIDGIETALSYDERGRVTRVSKGGSATTFEYTGDEPLPRAVVTPEHGREGLEYRNGYVTRTRDATGVETVVERDAVGNALSQGVADRAPWRSAFDAEGNVVSTMAPSGRMWTAEWDPRRQLRAEVDPLGRRTSYTYDPAGRLTKQELPGGRVSTLRYDGNGLLVEQTSADDLRTGYVYDQLGDLRTTNLPSGMTWTSSREHRPDGSTSTSVFAPDGGRTVSTIDSTGREIERSTFDSAGGLVETRRWTFIFAKTASEVVERSSSRAVTTYTYGRNGHVTRTLERVDDRVLNDTRYSYDRGLLASMSDGAATSTYDYDAAGRLVRSKSDADDLAWTAEFTSGRITKVTDDEGTRTIEYDTDGRATTFRNEGAVTRWLYDKADRPIERSVGDAVARFVWSDADQLTEYLSADGSTWSYTYDRAGRMVSATEPNQDLTKWTMKDGRIETKEYQGKKETYAYDTRGRLTKVGDRSYTYDATDLPIVVRDGGTEERWEYDAAGRIVRVHAGTESFAITYDASNRVSAISGRGKGLSATWDKGVRISVTDRSDLVVRTDDDDRISSADWDDKTSVEVKWAETAAGYALEMAQKGEPSQRYEVARSRIVAYSADKTSIAATTQSSGYLNSLEVRVGDRVGTARFDQLGRPAQVAGTAGGASTLSYDSTGRISSIATTKANKSSKTTVTYGAEGKAKIDGDDKGLVDAVFDDHGRLRAPLPSSLPNPRAGGLGDASAQTAELVAPPKLAVPEPDPLADVDAAKAANAPFLVSPIGVRDLKKVAEKMWVAEIARLAPTAKVNGDLSIRLPIVDPDDGKVARFNPFVDAVPSGLVAGLAAEQAGDGGSWLDRAKDTVDDIVGGTIALATDVVRFVVDNPIARLVLGAGAWSAASLVCGGTAAACLPVAAIAMFLASAETVGAVTTAATAIGRACPSGGVARCGLVIASGATAAFFAVATARVGLALADTFFARRAYAAAIDSGINAAQASGNVGTAKSELLAALRFERIVDREVPVCADGTCARLDLVSRDLLGRNRLIEVKNGADARLTPNQQVVYPLLRSSGAYFPNGLAGSSPQMVVAQVQIQHWGSVARLTL